MSKFPMQGIVAGLAVGVILAVAMAAPDRAESKVVPNDPYFRYQVSFENPGGRLAIPLFSFKPSEVIYETAAGLDHNLPRAWALTTGSKKTIVALLDDGYFYQHEDIRENLWRNPGESGVDASGHSSETNGIDDDGDGYVDDVMGWDFAFNDPDPDAYIFDGATRREFSLITIRYRRSGLSAHGVTMASALRASIGVSR